MSVHDPGLGDSTRTQFKGAALALDPALVEVVQHLARIAARADYKTFLATGEIPYSSTEPKGGRP